ncbi:hypothetical protein pEaSNUABM40_00070 [Erwinia phage pEa_SNUABM_40]|uniref:Uncharacterized protein n=1 Tax=Erwinia phage pEa_SNUABM_3 TaxID=2869552 RepID=A0AAE7XIX3_9CAUD|nr:hypothetical protein MPK68_gp070 [Erwinia phage pEa_SNUABM_3]QZE56606.1 hypothetical protein pEaSNUABM20_00070 [Erwinia phage pEa_SNUABM_20]QZE58286.1 hypothetical protein pEaSNUABM40_00070 [Erwinia phage pEa_SNUABM_40]UAW52851.1 hypothetical protein pEaSNUABM23_00069 [Erwinia phage pEa_SNUABM_23]UIW10747.1 hypothetical protein pEaSNUABM23_00069 [Erwinia phage pEa_SNUABM_31]QZE56267.1 hypothetical protein pEaSNUABM3_00070 [Erwinia phage pEa_SNUABM_3]
MQSVAGQPVELTAKDVEAYWRGRAYIEAARLAHESHEDPTAHTLSHAEIAPFLDQGNAIIEPLREQHEQQQADAQFEHSLPDAVFEEGNTLEPRFVILLALMLDSEKQVGGKTLRAMADISAYARDKKIVLVLNGHDTELARHLARESGYEVKESGLIEATQAISAKMLRREQLTGFFELDTPRVRKEPDPNLKAVRQSHNRVGRHSGHQRFNAKPQRQNFKGRGR